MTCPTFINLKVLTDCIGFRQEQSITDLQRDCLLKLAICRPNLGRRSPYSALSRAATAGKASGGGKPLMWPPLWRPCMPKIGRGGPAQ
jgi:hypothetical protein